jgi:hypothetical protein
MQTQIMTFDENVYFFPPQMPPLRDAMVETQKAHSCHFPVAPQFGFSSCFSVFY